MGTQSKFKEVATVSAVEELAVSEVSESKKEEKKPIITTRNGVQVLVENLVTGQKFSLKESDGSVSDFVAVCDVMVCGVADAKTVFLF